MSGIRSSRVKNPRKFLMRYFGGIAVVLAIAAFAAPFLFAMVPQDAQTLYQLGGAVGGVGMVLLITSCFMRGKRDGI